MTVEKAVYLSYNKLNQKFSVLDLIKMTREEIGRPHLTDGTITRKLRKLRIDGNINYKVIDNRKALYKKIYSETQTKLEL